jgi:hypothetical protein
MVRDFFISRAGECKDDAVWVAKQLRNAGYTTFLQDEDSDLIGNVMEVMTLGAECKCTLALMSPKYFESRYTEAEWRAAWLRELDTGERHLVWIKLQECERPKFLRAQVPLNFVGKTETQRREMLLAYVSRIGMTPSVPTACDERAHPGPQTDVAMLLNVGRFLIGREKEMKILDQAWSRPEPRDPVTGVVSIVAPGGVGKSSLAIEWWRQKRAVGAAEVFGWSFSATSRQDPRSSAEPFLEYALQRWFDVAFPPKDSWAKGERLAELIRSERAVVILDGLEPIQESTGQFKDPGMTALLKELATTNPGLCICTSRLPLTDLDIYAPGRVLKLDLEDLDPKDGAEYLGTLGVKGDERSLREASEQFGNHALALTLLGSYLVEYCRRRVDGWHQIPSIPVGTTKPLGHARRVMRQYEAVFKGKPELAILRMLGLFDRPTDVGAARLLRSKFFPQAETQERAAVKHLRDSRLMYEDNGSATLDCHPLVRDHFGEELRRSHPDVFISAHNELYEYYSKKAAYQPETLTLMKPLFYAVYHGCTAEKHQDACDRVYSRRLLRGDKSYLGNKLGAYGVNLSLLENFFQSPWHQPVDTMAPVWRSSVTGWAAVSLRALGRLAEAVGPAILATEAYIKLGNWKGAAAMFLGQSELNLTLGSISTAINNARAGLQMADQSGDASLQIAARTTLADALHKSGLPARAADLFAEADQMQAQLRGRPAMLCSIHGYQYCDLMLAEGRSEDVLLRAGATVRGALKNRWPLDIALDRISLGRAHGAASPEATWYLEEAVIGLRSAGRFDHLPLGLLARAANFRHANDFSRAERDLQEVQTLATRCGMQLFLTDCHLEWARLELSKGRGELARQHADDARQLVAKTGYHRRDDELSSLDRSLHMDGPSTRSAASG